MMLLVGGVVAWKGCRKPDGNGEKQGGTARLAVIFDQFQCFTTGDDALEYELWVDDRKEDLEQDQDVLAKRRGNVSNQVFTFTLVEGIYWYRVRFNCLCKVDTTCIRRGYSVRDTVLDLYYRVYMDTFRVYAGRETDVILRF